MISTKEGTIHTPKSSSRSGVNLLGVQRMRKWKLEGLGFRRKTMEAIFFSWDSLQGLLEEGF